MQILAFHFFLPTVLHRSQWSCIICDQRLRKSFP